MGRNVIKRDLKINKKAKEGNCRIIENGEPCDRKTHCRGLCSRHHSYFIRCEIIDKFGMKEKYSYVEQNTYKINKKATKHCRIIQNGKKCKHKNHGRGLCAHHHLTFNRHGLLLKYGTKSQKDLKIFSVKKKTKEGQCRMIEDNKACKTDITSRGLCSKHYLRFLRDGRIKKFGIKKRKKPNG